MSRALDPSSPNTSACTIGVDLLCSDLRSDPPHSTATTTYPWGLPRYLYFGNPLSLGPKQGVSAIEKSVGCQVSCS